MLHKLGSNAKTLFPMTKSATMADVLLDCIESCSGTTAVLLRCSILGYVVTAVTIRTGQECWGRKRVLKAGRGLVDAENRSHMLPTERE